MRWALSSEPVGDAEGVVNVDRSDRNMARRLMDTALAEWEAAFSEVGADTWEALALNQEANLGFAVVGTSRRRPRTGPRSWSSRRKRA